MGFQNIEIKHSYISCGDNGIAESLISPALKQAVIYKRTAAYFSSSVFEQISDGILSLVGRKGSIQLVCGPELSQSDNDAIAAGYATKAEMAAGQFTISFEQALQEFSDKSLRLLYELVSKGYLEIKIAYKRKTGIYHDKLGILKDADGNTIVFYGSANATGSAYETNYEKIRVISNILGDNPGLIEDEEIEFDRLWKNENEFLSVTNYSESAITVISRVIKNKSGENKTSGVRLRDYQEEAIKAWVDNGYHGFYVMATGTGKTWTAIYSAKKLMENHPCLTVICAPYKHLVKQWCEDVEKVFPKAHIILVSSENPGWTNQLNEEIIRSKYENSQIIAISTIKSFTMERFDKTIQKADCEKLLIVDEAHRFTSLEGYIKERYQYMLGLSATPGNGKNQEFVDRLLDFFGGKVFDLPIESALERGFLVPYNYYPIFVDATSEEESEFSYYSKVMASCFVNGKCVDPDKLAVAYRGRLRVIGMAQEKEDKIGEIISKIKETDHFVIYCGDGKIYDTNKGEEVRHIQFVKNQLSKKGYKASQFTATENMAKRMELVDGFNKGEFDALVAIRCLDEGINIPSIEGALILASNDDYREFVQRRGRILRLYGNKKYANIYDVIVLPSSSMTDFAMIEFKRFYEYARLSINVEENMDILKHNLEFYGIDIDSLSIFDDVEDDIDE